MRPDAPGSVHSDQKLWNPYFRYREQARGAPAISERRWAESGEPGSGSQTGPSRSELLRLKSDLLALQVHLAVIGHAMAVSKARGLPPVTKADPAWQIYLKAHARFEVAWRKAGFKDNFRKAGFNPDQARVPAGSDPGGGINDPRVLSDATPDNTWIPGERYAQNDQLGAYDVDLREEQARGGHTIEKHVNRSREALIAQAREAFAENASAQDSRSGSFSSLEAATRLINSTLSKNQAIVDQVARGDLPAAVVSASFGSITGIEAVVPNRRSQPIF